jgi:lysophospholipase L1-like esterase
MTKKIILFYGIAAVITTICISLILGEATYRVYRIAKAELMRMKRAQVKQNELCGFVNYDAYEDPEQGLIGSIGKLKNEYNTYLGYIPKASYTDVKLKTNKYHLRYEADFPQQKENGECRIFITGGSVAFGYGITQKKLYTTIMENLFAKEYPHRKIRVISAGVCGYCSVQERIMIENLILSLSPDYIVMFSGWNDLIFGGYRGMDILMENDFCGFKNRIEKNTQKNLIDPPKYNDYIFKLHFLIDNALYEYKYRNKKLLFKDINTKSITPESVVKILLRNVHIISDLSKRFNFRFIFYLQPSIYSTDKKLTNYEKEFLKDDENITVGLPEYIQKAYKIYEKLLPRDAAENGYYYIDGDNAIANETKSAFIDEAHFGDRGNDLIANHMFREIKKIMKE